MLPRQRVPVQPTILEARPLSRADLARLPQKRENNGIVAKLRNHHHRIARLDATGIKNYQICEICDITDARLQQLRKSPAYQELVSVYRREVIAQTAEQVDEFTRLSMRNMLRAEQQVADHIDEAEEAGELIPLKTLLSITSDRADRFGYPKGSVVAKVNMGDALQRAMVRSGRTIVVDAKGAPALAPRGAEGSDATSAPSPARALPSRRGL